MHIYIHHYSTFYWILIHKLYIFRVLDRRRSCMSYRIVNIRDWSRHHSILRHICKCSWIDYRSSSLLPDTVYINYQQGLSSKDMSSGIFHKLSNYQFHNILDHKHKFFHFVFYGHPFDCMLNNHYNFFHCTHNNYSGRLFIRIIYLINIRYYYVSN